MSVFTTPLMRAAYAARYPELAERFVAIPNGYDRSDLSQVPAVRDEGRATFRLVYAGSLYGDVELGLFLDGLHIALEHRPALRQVLRVEFIGWLSRSNQVIADRAARSDGIEGIVSFGGFRPRSDALARVASADACLLILADKPGRDLIIPVKLFEYLGLDRPVLAIVPNGAVKEALADLGWGVVVGPEPNAIARGIEQIVTQPRPTRPADPDGRYERVGLAAELAGLLEGTERMRTGIRSK
jgi:glycosyltransferase involved in cell wall biosynthesis